MNKRTKIVRDSPKHKKWRVNYTVSYANKTCALCYRERVLETLSNIAFFRGIDVETSLDFPFFDEQDYEEQPNLKALITDLVYFRSSRQTKISARDFRKLIDHVFEEHGFLGLGRHNFEVLSQMQKALPQYPFPVNNVSFS
ncbi:MAG: hypothetical protein VB022_10900 [Rikenellaceae bacterium]|nr:hypothetical protein [Rikenellaceae bacterium]